MASVGPLLMPRLPVVVPVGRKLLGPGVARPREAQQLGTSDHEFPARVGHRQGHSSRVHCRWSEVGEAAAQHPAAVVERVLPVATEGLLWRS